MRPRFIETYNNPVSRPITRILAGPVVKQPSLGRGKRSAGLRIRRTGLAGYGFRGDNGRRVRRLGLLGGFSASAAESLRNDNCETGRGLLYVAVGEVAGRIRSTKGVAAGYHGLSC